MPMFDYDCGGCGQRFEVLVGGALGLEAPAACPDCDSPELRRAWTFEGHVSRTTFDTPGDRAMHLQHKRYVEDLARKDQIVSIKEQGPLEYRPEFQKRLH